MLTLLVSLILLLVIFGIVYWIVGQIPVPPDFRWIVNVAIGLIFLLAVIGLFWGGYSFFPGHPVMR